MSDRDIERSRLLTRRALVVGGAQTLALGLVGSRLYFLQITEGERLRRLAERNRTETRPVAPTRGLILDRFGQRLAVNVQSFRAILRFEDCGDAETALAAVSRVIPLTQAEIDRFREQLAERSPFIPILIKEGLTFDQVAALSVQSADLPGVAMEEGEVRVYPFEDEAAHIIGYLAKPRASDVKADPILRLTGARVGRAGLENAYETMLKGRAGESLIEVNAQGRVLRELSQTPGDPGKNLALSIDMGLQQFAHRRLSEYPSGAAIVMDAYTGEVYALVSIPGYDPNAFIQGPTFQQMEELNSDEKAPLLNKAISGQYPPGSTFKMVTAMAALEAGEVNPADSFTCNGYLELGTQRFHCWKPSGHGDVSLVEALAYSCDVYFYEIARRVGIERIAEMARRFGYGDRLGLNLPGEKPGIVPTQAWKKAQYGQDWLIGETMVNAIGQGYMLATPLQVAAMTARLINGGLKVKPTLTLGAGLPPEGMGLDRRNLAAVMAGMRDCVQHKDGTAHAARIDVAGWEMGGKTGTAQVRRITMAQRKAGIRNEDLPWRDRHHAWFCGYAPVAAPRYVCCVLIEHGGGGAATAAPIARDLLAETQRRDPGRAIRPPSPARPLVEISGMTGPQR